MVFFYCNSQFLFLFLAIYVRVIMIIPIIVIIENAVQNNIPFSVISPIMLVIIIAVIRISLGV